MKYAPPLLLALAGCVSDERLAKLQAEHRAYVCSHQVAVTIAANAVIENAGNIGNEAARAAAVAIAKSDLAIVARCGG